MNRMMNHWIAAALVGVAASAFAASAAAIAAGSVVMPSMLELIINPFIMSSYAPRGSLSSWMMAG